jgi:hypothetical protein
MIIHICDYKTQTPLHSLSACASIKPQRYFSILFCAPVASREVDAMKWGAAHKARFSSPHRKQPFYIDAKKKTNSTFFFKMRIHEILILNNEWKF